MAAPGADLFNGWLQHSTPDVEVVQQLHNIFQPYLTSVAFPKLEPSAKTVSIMKFPTLSDVFLLYFGVLCAH